MRWDKIIKKTLKYTKYSTKKKPLLTELAECIQIWNSIIIRVSMKKIIKSFKKKYGNIIKLTSFIFAYIQYMFKVMWNTDIIFKHGYLMKIPIESSKKKSEYSVYVYEALDVRLFPNKRFSIH